MMPIVMVCSFVMSFQSFLSIDEPPMSFPISCSCDWKDQIWMNRRKNDAGDLGKYKQ